MFRLAIAFLLMYGTVGGIETDYYAGWLQPFAQIVLSGLIVFTVWLDGTFDRWNRESK